MKKTITAIAVAAAASFGGAAHAASVDIIGGSTTVTVTADLAGLGLSGAPAGTASVDIVGGLAAFTFGITGGEVLMDGNALIEHEGSGVTLTAGTLSATVGDFLIDTAAANVTGTLNGAVTGVEFFTFGPGPGTGVQLLISSTLAGALTDVFGAPDLTGAEFGFAVPSPAIVPLPAGGLLLLTGLGALALRGRKKAA